MATTKAKQFYERTARFGASKDLLLSKISIAAGSSSIGEITISHSGWNSSPVAILGYESFGKNEEYVNIYRLRLTGVAKGSATIAYSLRNRGTANATYSLMVDILWV